MLNELGQLIYILSTDTTAMLAAVLGRSFTLFVWASGL